MMRRELGLSRATALAEECLACPGDQTAAPLWRDAGTESPCVTLGFLRSQTIQASSPWPHPHRPHIGEGDARIPHRAT